MANRRNPDAQPVEATEEAVVAAPVVEEKPAPAPATAPAPVPAPAAPKAAQGGFAGDADEIHRKYFIPPAGYQKPKFPSSI